MLFSDVEVIRTFLIVFVLFFMCATAVAQERVISGVVSDSVGAKIAEAASSAVDISMKAKPLERPVSRSSTTLADSTVPA